MAKFVAVGGGEIGRPGFPIETLSIDSEIIRLTGKSRPNLLFLPTASGDDEGYTKVVEDYFGSRLGCNVSVLYLKDSPTKVYAQKLVDKIEAEITTMLKQLVSPSEEVITWVADTMRDNHQDSSESNDKLANSIQAQIERLARMEDNLYDDKLAGEITSDRYTQKHDALVVEKTILEERLGKIDYLGAKQLEQKLVLLELSQKAAQVYSQKLPEQKRTIITKLFGKLVYSNGAVSVTYTNFSRAIAQNVKLTHQIIGGAK